MADTEHSCASGTERLNIADIKMTGLKAVKVKFSLEQAINFEQTP
jgi:S-adenosylhomocysteine hydrolase